MTATSPKELVLTAQQRINTTKLKKILNNQDEIKKLLKLKNDFNFSIYKQYYNLIEKNDGKVSIDYYQKLDSNNKPYGRMVSDKFNIQSMEKEIRTILIEDLYYDVDIANCGPTILSHLCKEHKINCKNLNEYINNRNKIIDELLYLNSNKKYNNIKEAINSLINNGNAYLLETEWLGNFKREINDIRNKFMTIYKDLVKEINNVENIEGSLMARIIMDKENEIINQIINYLKENKIIKDEYIPHFDALFIPKDNIPSINVIMRMIEDHISKKLKINIKLIEKEMFGINIDHLKNDEYLLEQYNMEDEYYWFDFINLLKNTEWKSLDDAIKYAVENINRVLILTANNNMQIKKDKVEPYTYLDKLPVFSIKYILNENIKTFSFRKFMDTYIFNYIKIYNNLIYLPKSPNEPFQHEEGRDFNIWNGFQAQLIQEEAIEIDKIEPMLNHIKVVFANNDEHIYKYILSWFHHIFTKPYEKTKIAMVLQSDEQQIGKGIFMDFLDKFIFGRRLATTETGIDFTKERFNQHLMGKLLICCEELSTLTGDYHRTFDILKKIITNPTIKIEIKGGAKFEINDYVNLLLFTNNDFSIKVEQHDRRYFIQKCNPIYQNNYDYFNELKKSSFNQETANHFFSYVFYMKDNVNILDIPKTKLKQEMRLNSLSSCKRFLHRIKEVRDEYKDHDHKEEPINVWIDEVCTNDEIPANLFYSYYKSYCMQENEKPLSQTKFGRDISNMIEKRRKIKGITYDLLTIKEV
jgi:hypothetical protein